MHYFTTSKSSVHLRNKKHSYLEHNNYKRSAESSKQPSAASLLSKQPSYVQKTQQHTHSPPISGIASQNEMEGKAGRGGSHATLRRGEGYPLQSGISGMCQSDSTVALAGTSCGAGVGAWERNSVRLAFGHGVHETTSMRTKCAAFWAQVDKQPHIKAMCAYGHAKTKEERQEAIAEAEAAFQEFLGKESEGSYSPDARHFTDGSQCAESCPRARRLKEEEGMRCAGKTALAVRVDDTEDHEDGRGRVGPWQRRLRVLQALGLDRLAAAAEWRESPIAPPADWPRGALLRPEPGGPPFDENDPRIVPAARPPTPSQWALLEEDVLKLPPPLLPAQPGGSAPPDMDTGVYRVMPLLRLPPPEKPGPPPEPVLPCPTQWCDASPCRECIPCDPRYAEALHPQRAKSDAAAASIAPPDEKTLPAGISSMVTDGEREYYDETGHHKDRHQKYKKHRKHKGRHETTTCHPGCRCCLCLASAPPPTPTLAYRRQTASKDRTHQHGSGAKTATADTLGGNGQGDSNISITDQSMKHPGEAKRSKGTEGEDAMAAGKAVRGSWGGSGGRSGGGSGGGSAGGSGGGSGGGSRDDSSPRPSQKHRESGGKNVVITDMVDGTQYTMQTGRAEEPTSRNSSRRTRLDSAGEVVGLDKLATDPLKEEDPFRSVLLDVLKPGHVRPPLPPPQVRPAPPRTSAEDDDHEYKCEMHGSVIPDLFATDGQALSAASLCQTWVSPIGDSGLPRPPPPSHYVMPGADLSGELVPPAPPTVAPPGEQSHYVGLNAQKWPSSASVATLPPLRRASAAAGAAAANVSRRIPTMSTSPGFTVAPSGAQGKEVQAKQSRHTVDLKVHPPKPTTVMMAMQKEGVSPSVPDLPQPTPATLGQQYVQPGAAAAGRWRPWLAPPVAREPPVRAHSVLSWTAVSRSGLRRGGGARTLIGTAEVSTGAAQHGAMARSSSQGGLPTIGPLRSIQRLGAGSGTSLASAGDDVAPGTPTAAGSLSRGLPAGAALTSVVLPSAVGGGRIVLLSEPAEPLRPTRTDNGMPLPLAHTARQAAQVHERKMREREMYAIQQQQMEQGAFGFRRKKRPSGSKSRISFSQEAERQMHVTELSSPATSAASLIGGAIPTYGEHAAKVTSGEFVAREGDTTGRARAGATPGARFGPPLSKWSPAGRRPVAEGARAWAGPEWRQPTISPENASYVPPSSVSPTPSRRPRPSAPKPGRRSKQSAAERDAIQALVDD